VKAVDNVKMVNITDKIKEYEFSHKKDRIFSKCANY